MKSSTQTKTGASLRWPGIVGNCGMKATKSAALGMLCALGFVSAVAADPPNSNQFPEVQPYLCGSCAGSADGGCVERPPTKYVVLTGSYIPQKVVVRSIGTNTTDPRRIYNRNEIDKTGRVTTEGVLRLDPSLTVVSGHGSGVTINTALIYSWLGRAAHLAARPCGILLSRVVAKSVLPAVKHFCLRGRSRDR